MLANLPKQLYGLISDTASGNINALRTILACRNK
jgi:hypothetical protein